MNYPLMHTLTFDVLYGCAGILIFIVLERAIYLSYLAVRAARIARDLGPGAICAAPTVMYDRKPGDPITQAVARYVDVARNTGVTRGELEDYSAALYIEVDKKITARLWILDTIITAAPLLGLLGTIFGIMQTFTALSDGGVSDPAEVSRGIGLALTATAIGIAVALVGLVAHNVLNRRAHLLTESFKFFVLRLTPAAPLKP
jgi:biopolymer transport protein ExbB